MRGISARRRLVCVRVGIIPAGAGHLQPSYYKLAPPWDHPRRCGAFGMTLVFMNFSTGSSPQVRGTLRFAKHHQCRGGIIPAGAGHFFPDSPQEGNAGDHPRRCGELVLRTLRAPRLLGSSPQVRGTSGDGSPGLSGLGIIPAGAGHLSGLYLPVRLHRDHPRRCGALDPNARMGIFVPGSSPQVRGTYYSRPQSPKSQGIIPAGAGHFFVTSSTE